MFSNIENVNILTNVLKRHGVRRVVVCPGSRNAPLVHNLNEIDGITCYPVTDERSAGFVALGMALGDPSPCPDPVAVCVTSGSALLNLYPAVAEAYYQKLPVIFISADRPGAWIGQQDGQTLPQPDVFGTMVNKSVNLPIITPRIHSEEGCLPANAEAINSMHDEQAWLCERLVNEALIDCKHRKIGPVHINIPIPEPLYEFTCRQLPQAHKVDYIRSGMWSGDFHYGDLLDFLEAKKPMIIIGQDYPASILYGIKNIQNWAVILCEPTALGLDSKDPADRKFSTSQLMTNFEEVLYQIEVKKAEDPDFDEEAYLPDFILYTGGNIVSKRLKQFLRKAAQKAQVWRVSKDGDYIDTFMRTDRIFQANVHQLADAMTSYEQKYPDEVNDYRDLWTTALRHAKRHAYDYEPEYSSMATVRYFEQEFHANSKKDSRECRVFYGNSMAIRLGCIYAHQYVFCNRGVNGIEGTLSAAAGLSIYLSEYHHPDAQKQQKVFCILGDLSFFYDQNALWNQNLNGSLRIIVLNNGGGAIFGKFKGLKESAARENLVMAEHQTSAVNICQANNITYLGADNMKTMKYGIDQLIHSDSERPMLLEVFTDIDADNRALEDYFKSL